MPARMFGTVVLILLVTITSAVAVNLDESQEIAVQNVFMQMLKIHPPSNLSAVKSANPPKHMLELYEKLSTRGGNRRSSNTVRSILPLTNHRHSSELVVFNVTCIDQNEDVQLAQLHIHRRRFHRHRSSDRHSRRTLAPPYRVRLYQILHAHSGREKSGFGRGRTKPLASIPVPHFTRGGWHTLDITSALRELLFNSQSPNVHLMLGIRFEAPKGKPVPPSHFLQYPLEVDNETANSSPAFLVVFSEDGSDNDLPEDDGTEPIFPPPQAHTHLMAELLQSTGKAFLIDNSTESPSPAGTETTNEINETNEDLYIDETENDYNLRHKHKIKTIGYQIEDMEESNNINVINHHPTSFERRYLDIVKNQGNGEILGKRRSMKKFMLRLHDIQRQNNQKKKRYIRSIIDNELPDKHALPVISVTQPPTNAALKERANSDEIIDGENTIPYPPYGRRWRSGNSGSGGGGGKKKKGKGRKKEHRKKNKKTDNFHILNKADKAINNVTTSDKSTSCGRRKLVVDFRVIGWDSWIINPPSFDAYYCDGKCPFPIVKDLKPTNHATIQSLLHEKGIEPGIPAPCCVPDHLSSMSLLYIENERNIVLKVYNNMIVDSCACR